MGLISRVSSRTYRNAMPVKRPYAKPPSGIKPSYHSGILTSTTGIPSLDPLLGGGITMGSLVLLEQDSNSAYSKIIERCFLSAGVECCHQIFYHSNSKNDNSFKLYYKGDENEGKLAKEKEKKQLTSNDNMKIAWQYQNDSVADMMGRHSVSKSTGGIFIDLGKEMDVEDGAKRVAVVKNFDQGKILENLDNFYGENSPNEPTNPRMIHKRVAFRVLISGFKNCFWESSSDSRDFKFLADLRKKSPINSLTMVTMPSSLVTKQHRRYFDACISISSLSAQLQPTNLDYEQGSIRKMGY